MIAARRFRKRQKTIAAGDRAHSRKLTGRTAAFTCFGDVFHGTHFYRLFRSTARLSRPAAGRSATWGWGSCGAGNPYLVTHMLIQLRSVSSQLVGLTLLVSQRVIPI